MHCVEEAVAAAAETSTTATQHSIRQDSNFIQNELWIRLCRMSIFPIHFVCAPFFNC